MLSPNPNPHPISFASSPRRLFPCGLVGESSFVGSKFPHGILSFSTKKIRAERSRPVCVSAMNSTLASHSFDVVIIGAGIIGLSIARQFLLHSDLSVAVVDKEVPCSGATGAGKILMAHLVAGEMWKVKEKKWWCFF